MVGVSPSGAGAGAESSARICPTGRREGTEVLSTRGGRPWFWERTIHHRLLNSCFRPTVRGSNGQDGPDSKKSRKSSVGKSFEKRRGLAKDLPPQITNMDTLNTGGSVSAKVTILNRRATKPPKPDLSYVLISGESPASDSECLCTAFLNSMKLHVDSFCISSRICAFRSTFFVLSREKINFRLSQFHSSRMKDFRVESR